MKYGIRKLSTGLMTYKFENSNKYHGATLRRKGCATSLCW